MAEILRGDILWADLDPTRSHEQRGLRPILVLSHAVFNDHSGTVIAVALTSQKPKVEFPLVLELKGKKLPKPSWVKISQVRTLSTERLGKKIGSASEEEVSQVIDGLLEIISYK